MTLDTSGRPTWAEIDLDALCANYRKLENLLRRGKPADMIATHLRLIPAIKADAYGHGAVRVAHALSRAGAKAFAVAIVEEGASLRSAGIGGEILVLEGPWPGQEAHALDAGLTLAVFSPEAVRRIEAAAARRGQIVDVHVKIDTGMSRLGAPWDRLDALVEQLRAAPHVRVSGIFSHLAAADEEDRSFTLEQARRFRLARSRFHAARFEPIEMHLANSAGLLFFPELSWFSARPGIALYGYAPAPDRSPAAFEPVLSLKSRLGHIHRVAAGQTIGYNRRFRAPRDMIAATIPAGYADGYRRGLSGKAKIIVRDAWADVVGTVSMDMIVADISHLQDPREGEEVILLGSSSSCRFNAEDWAAALGTICYEVLCGISPRVPRLYLEHLK
jgi:alanine racemase